MILARLCPGKSRPTTYSNISGVILVLYINCTIGDPKGTKPDIRNGIKIFSPVSGCIIAYWQVFFLSFSEEKNNISYYLNYFLSVPQLKDGRTLINN